MKDTPWDHGLRVFAEADGLVGHAGAVLLRKLADQAGLTAALGSALARAGKFPLVDRGMALVSMAVAIVLGRPGRSLPRRGRSRCRPEHIGQHRRPPETANQTSRLKAGTTRSVTNLAPPLNHRG